MDARPVSAEGELADRFLALHAEGVPLLLANAWDQGSAKLLAGLGFQALATTSSGHAGTLGRLDGTVTRDEALAHAAAIVSATDRPVSADLEDCFAVEDSTRREEQPIHELALAAERVAAAADAAHSGPARIVLTARAENYLHGRRDLADTIARLQAYQEAGADVLYAPGLVDLDEIRTLVAAVDRPVNVLALPGAPSVARLADAGVRRISVGGAFFYVALGGVVEAGRELLDLGTYEFWDRARTGAGAARPTFR
jgi:2-methylisocitrate lyase-like PEP mutase family enzyme